MCTVTFIPHQQGVFITSNRDEQVSRSMAAVPQFYTINNKRIIFPKDGKAGGTWVAASASGDVMVLLNGGFHPHVMGGTYRKSRGLIFLDIFSADNPVQKFKEIDLDKIEPFTLALWHENKLWDLRWDGMQKFQEQKDETLPHIWSSAQLYSPETRANRELWFGKWLKEKNVETLTINDVKHFHTFGGQAESVNDALVMHRGDILQTISITAIDWHPHFFTMSYHDLIHGSTTDVSSKD